MLQQGLIILLFIGSLVYLGKLIYKQFTAKSGCASGCGSCSSIDFAQIEKKIKASEK